MRSRALIWTLVLASACSGREPTVPDDAAQPVERAPAPEPAQVEPTVDTPEVPAIEQEARTLIDAAKRVADAYAAEPNDCAAINKRLESLSDELARLQDASDELSRELANNPTLAPEFGAAMESIVSGRVRCR